MRLAWFTPWPPERSGVAGRSAELVPALASAGHGIDVCVDERTVPVERVHGDDPPAPGSVRVQSAHDFVWRATRHQYDVVVYQLGNSQVHEFIWPYVFRWPGLVVLHDARLHHARARAHLGARRAAAYRAEFAWNQPDVSPDAAELAVAGFDGPYYYLWPMVRDLVTHSRLVAVHSRTTAAELAETYPDRPIEYLTLGEGPDVPCDGPAREATRAELGLAPSSVVFGLFGALTDEKRVAQVVRALRASLSVQPDARLLLAGAPSASPDWQALARSYGVERAVSFLGILDDAAFDRAIAAVDVSVNLRWPTALETSGPWLRALAAGRPTVVIDLAHQTDVPALDPRTWQPATPGNSAEPVTIAIDILDEDHSLALAFRRLAADAALRDRLGRAARAYWERTHTVGRMRDDYLAAIARAGALPLPATPPLPSLVYDPLEYARTLVADFGDDACGLC